ncbi:MAG: hypothetical protein C0404_03170 [Verrucomicrobia bacterium]|nr:hypothetical protein [Verrucomicrobiota bacterium]
MKPGKLVVDEHCRAILESWHQRIFVKDSRLVYVACSHGFSDCLGLRPSDVLGKRDMDLFGEAAAGNRAESDNQAMKTGHHEVADEEYPVKGCPVGFRVVRTAIRDSKKNVIGVMGLLLDDRLRKHAEASQELLLHLLATINTSAEVGELLTDMVDLIKRHTGAQAVGIRFLRGTDYPYAASTGISRGMLEADNNLVIASAGGAPTLDKTGDVALDCMCGRVIRGTTISSRPYYTSGGSFWTNSVKDFLPFMEKFEGCPEERMRCAAEGFESLAIVPLICGLEIVGVLQLGDGRRDFFDASDIRFFEKIGSSIGNAVRKIEAEHALQETNARLQEALSDLEKTRASVIRQERLSAIGQMAGGVAHDFNNILMSIVGFTEIALQSAPEKGEQRECLTHILSSGKRAKEIIAQIMTISRRARPELKPVKLHAVVDDALKLIRAGIPSIVEIAPRLDDSCGYVLADATQIHQVVMNLTTNARDAMGSKGGTVRVELVPFRPDGTFRARHKECGASQFSRLTVSDNGSGMDEATQARIFEPYYTTKERGKGTGLGLATVHSIMLGLGGAIEVRSAPGKGTSFALYFPVCENGPEPLGTAIKSSAQIRGGTERILLVDDEEQLLVIGRTMLAKMGYQVETFNGSQQALAKIGEDPSHYDLVITDHTMPKMTGLDLAKQVRLLRPDLPVVLCTGFSSEMVSSEMVAEAGVLRQLRKPYSLIDLSEVVRLALDAAAGAAVNDAK